MVEALEPATLDFSADGAPWSTRFEAPYYPPGDALARSRRVFLDGNALPARWQGRERFYYTMPFGERFIWGVTAGIIRSMFERLYR